MKIKPFYLIVLSLQLGSCAFAEMPAANKNVVWLDDLNLNLAKQSWGVPQAKKSVAGYDLSVGGQKFDHGFGTHATSTLNLKLDGNVRKFTASVGVDDSVEYPDHPRIYFSVIGNGEVLWKSGIMQLADPPKTCEVNLAGVTHLSLQVLDASNVGCFSPADWADAKFEIAGHSPETLNP